MSRLVLEINHNDPAASRILLSYILWPTDEKTRLYYVASFSTLEAEYWRPEKSDYRRAESLAEAEKLVNRVAAGTAFRHGVGPNEILDDKERESLVAEHQYGASELVRRSFHNLLNEVGGPETTAHAPGVSRLRELGEKAQARAFWASRALILVRSMADHHPDLSPSLSRAWAILAVEDCKRGGQLEIPSSKNHFFNEWKKYNLGSIAHLYAAYLLLAGTVNEDGPLRPADLHSSTGVMIWLSWAAGLAAWGRELRAKGATATLLSHSELIEVASPLPPKVPEVARLDPLQWHSARSFTHEQFSPANVLGSKLDQIIDLTG